MRIVTPLGLAIHIFCVVLVLSALGYLASESIDYIFHGIWWGIWGGFNVYFFCGKKYVP